MKRLLVLLSILTTLASCSKVEQGEGGIITGFGGEVKSLNTLGWEVTIFDSMETIDLTQNIVNLSNVTARDIDNVPLSELDAKITFNTNPEMVLDFYKKTKSISEIKDENGRRNRVLGYNVIKNEAVNELQKTISQFKSKDIIGNRTKIEQSLKDSLQNALNSRFGTFVNIVNVNLNTIKLDKEIERSLQLVQVTRNQQLEIDAQMAQVEARRKLVSAEMETKADVARRYGMTTKEYMELEIKRDFNKAIEKSGAGVMLHINK